VSKSFVKNYVSEAYHSIWSLYRWNFDKLSVWSDTLSIIVCFCNFKNTY